MIKLDIDLEGLEQINDPVLRDITKQLRETGAANYNIGNYSRKMGRELSNMRHKGAVLIAMDRRNKEYIIKLREPRKPTPGWMDQLNKDFKDMLKNWK